MLLKKGSSGADVSALQQKLGIHVDGDFGDDTETAVKKFQQAHGLKVDGVVGDETWKALNAPAVSPSANATTGTVTDFNKLVVLVIDTVEGGYYHPAMLDDGRLKTANPGAYATSGETMFGLDRSAGHDLFYSTPRPSNTVKEDVKLIESGAYHYKSDAAAAFWGAIDKANAKTNWKWNYLGGDLNAPLKTLAAQLMKPYFDYLSGKYLGDYAKYVTADARLTFHFAYACWNGPGWFKKFANDIRAAVDAGKKTSDELAAVALHSRLEEGLTPGSAPNALIKQGGEKIKSLFARLGGGNA